jgi:5'-nucleotidase
MTVTALVGTVAAVCTTGAFVPQIIKLRKLGGKDLSYQMLFLYLTGVLLWLVYGIQVHAVAVIWANALSVVMVLVSIILKANPPRKKLNLQSRGLGQRRLRIAVDMDEVIADSFGKQLDIYNRRTGANLTPELVTRKGLGTAIPHDRWEVFAGICHEEGFFANLELIEGSREALFELSRNHDVYIASAAMEVPSSFDGKYEWLQKNFPFIPTSQIVFCGDKNVINADVLVDDRSRHFREFRGTGILFTAPHNADEAAPLRANNWNDVLRILGSNQLKAAGEEPVARTFSMNQAG